MDKNIIALIVLYNNKIHHWLKCSNKSFLNRSADLMLTISLGNAFHLDKQTNQKNPSPVPTLSSYHLALAWVSGVSGEKGKDGSEKGREKISSPISP